ncbi:MAG: hypothetical protein H7Y86_17075 [Rhizobacter sp.]|nr:hypothetical protein [Ferruginibacter sp.]
MPNQHVPLLPNNYYHLYNRANGDDKLFRSDENYWYFLRRIKKYILPVAHLWTYSLMPNHFHLFVKIKEDSVIENYYKIKKLKEFDTRIQLISDFIMEQFSNCLNGYAKAFNKMYDRKGALFMDYLKRSIASDDNDITSFIFYSHKNAVHHDLTDKIGQWKYDSYQALISTGKTDLARAEVIEWFGSTQQFIKFHNQPVDLKNRNKYFD